MPGESIQVGPFIGGLNLFSDDTSVADNELVECLNFELDLDGSLKSRPPFVDLAVSMPLGATGNISLLGYFYAPGGVPYLIGSDGLSSTYYYNGTTWILITNTIAASAMAQFDDKAWLVSPVISGNPGGYWTPGGGFVTSPNMPHGDMLVGYKYRLWVARGRAAVSNGTRLYFSDVLGSAPFWKVAPDFIDIGAGDGQNIVQLWVYYNSLLVFRTDSIYSFQYTSDPAAGQTSVLVPGVGLSDKDTVVSKESSLFFMYEDNAYEFINNRVSQINIKVPFEAVSRSGFHQNYAVSVFNNRIIYSFFDTMYVFGLKTRTWTRWRTTVHGSIGKIAERESSSENEEAVAVSNLAVPMGGSRAVKTLHITDGITTASETMRCVARTKNYTYEVSSAYKRMFWWGADAVFRSEVKATATPISYSYAVMWGDILTSNWGNLLNFYWDQPLSLSLSEETVRNTSGDSALRKFVKLGKSFRFRQVSFEVDFACDGSSGSAPVRLFSLVTYVRQKQSVSKPVT